MSQVSRGLDERRARILLSRIAEPYDERVQALVQEYGIHDVVGYALTDGVTPDGTRLSRLQTRLDRALSADDEHIAATLGARLIVPSDEEWPAGMHALEHPPWCLWVRGPLRLDEIGARSVAIVGARASTAYGDHVAAQMAIELADKGFAIVSGAAFGIDIAAQRATLAAGGDTIAVLAGGVDVPYPRAHSQQLEQIGHHGAIVSETPPGGAPARMRFLARNRLIAALATGTLIVEAGLRSGARTTMRHARELGRPIMALPGPVTSVVSAGCHAEIRFGATLVTDAAEVAEHVGRMGVDLAPVKQGRRLVIDAVGEEARRVWQWLRPRSSATVDELMLRSGLSLAEVQIALSELEQEGLAEQLLDGWVRRGEQAQSRSTQGSGAR